MQRTKVRNFANISITATATAENEHTDKPEILHSGMCESMQSQSNNLPVDADCVCGTVVYVLGVEMASGTQINFLQHLEIKLKIMGHQVSKFLQLISW